MIVRQMHLFLLTLLLVPVAAHAQAKGKGAVDTTPPAPPPPAPRAGWLSDRQNLKVGDLLTVVVDEHAQSSEVTANTAHNTRAQAGALNGSMVPTALQQIGINYSAQSDHGGQIDHSGGLSATLTVRILSIGANGVVRIQGQKLVDMDGRKQEVTVAGLVRTDDIGASNTVSSSRIADASIAYKGKSISPSTGLLGKLLAALWP